MSQCNFSSLGKARNGRRLRYWCQSHRCLVELPLDSPQPFSCSIADAQRPQQRSLTITLKDFPGGIALWGALPPVLDTSGRPPEIGVHVHARTTAGGCKVVDATFDEVHFSSVGPFATSPPITLTGEAAASFNIATILDRKVRYLMCKHCGSAHVDAGSYAVRYHRKHMCQACGRDFLDAAPSIGSPIPFLQEQVAVASAAPQLSPRHISFNLSDYPGGVQIWGSHPAVLWTSPKPEEAGIHVHAFQKRGGPPTLDETYGSVEIAGYTLDPGQVRVLMAQLAVPFLAEAVIDVRCTRCNQSHFDRGDLATSPHTTHLCEHCGHSFTLHTRRKPSVGNPLVGILSRIRAAQGGSASTPAPRNSPDGLASDSASL